jgi:hypothetical protein
MTSARERIADLSQTFGKARFGPRNEPAYAGARCARGGVRGNDGEPVEIGRQGRCPALRIEGLRTSQLYMGLPERRAKGSKTALLVGMQHQLPSGNADCRI